MRDLELQGVCHTCGREQLREMFECVGKDGELYCDSSCRGEDDALREFETEMESEMGAFYRLNASFPGSPYVKKSPPKTQVQIKKYG